MPDYHLHPLDDCFERVRRAGEHFGEMQNWTRRLRDCSNLDKHCKFVQHLGRSEITFWHGFETDLVRIDGVMRRTKHPAYGHVQVKVHISSKITLSDGTPIVQGIDEILTGVVQTLTGFKPDF